MLYNNKLKSSNSQPFLKFSFFQYCQKLMDQKQTKNQDPFQQVKNYISNYTKPQNYKAWLSISITIFYQIIAVVLIHSNLNFFGWGLHTLNQVRWFSIFHELAHNSFFSRPQLNRFVGIIIGIYGHFPYDFWRDGHNHHHKHFGNINRTDPSQTILFTKKQYESFGMPKKLIIRFLRQPIVYFFFSIPLLWSFGLLLLAYKRYGILSQSFFDKVFGLILYFFIFPMVGIPSLNMCISIYFAMVLSTVVFHLHHSVNVAYRSRKQNWNLSRSALQGSTYIKVPFFLKPFANGMEFHHIHHFNTNVASYAMQECHRNFETTKEGWDKYNINRVDYWTSIKSLINVMYDEDNNKLIPFSYKKL